MNVDIDLPDIRDDNRSLIDPSSTIIRVPYVETTVFYTNLIITTILFIIGVVILLIGIIIGVETYIAYPYIFNNFISMFISYKIFILILGIIRTIIGLLLLFFGIFNRLNIIFSVIIWIIYVLFNGIFGSFVGLIIVNASSDKITARIPIYTILFIFTIFIIITLIIHFLITLFGRYNRTASKLKNISDKNISIFRGLLLILSIIIFINGLPFGIFNNTPSWPILILMGLLILFLFLGILNEVFDRDKYGVYKRNPIEKSFYLIVLSSDLLLIITILIPSIGVRLFTNQVIVSNTNTASKEGNNENDNQIKKQKNNIIKLIL